MKRLGIIDIGSNTMRLVIMEITPLGHYRIVNELKRSARLAEGLDINNYLSDEKIQEGYSVLKAFKRMCDALNVTKIVAVGTAALRKAQNSNILIDKVQEKLDFDIRIIDGLQEAKYAFLGTINNIKIDKGIIIDIGGGSTEFICIDKGHIKHALSMPFGTIDIKRHLGNPEEDTLGDYEQLSRFLMTQFEEIPWLKSYHTHPIIGVGGIIRSIAKVDKAFKKYPMKLIHNYSVSKNDVDRIFNDIKDKPVVNLDQIKGLDVSRSDIFHGAMLLMTQLMAHIQSDEMIVCRGGIREGILHEYLNKNYAIETNLFDASISNVFHRYRIDKDHAIFVHECVQKMYKEAWHKSYEDIDIDKIITISSYLHDVGIDITFYDHNIHSFYVILYSGILGVSHKELLMSGFCALLHYKHEIELDEFESYLALLSENDIELIWVVGTLLRLAESFDSSMNRAVDSIDCQSTETTFTVQLFADEKPSIELAHAKQTGKAFHKIIGKKLIIEHVPQ